jgi:hypothetical protein
LLVVFFSALAIGAVSASTAVAAAPTVVTERPTEVHLDSATLHGTVNPQGHATKYWFEYTDGVTKHLTPEASAGESTTSVPVSALIGRLEPGVKYSFHIIAQSSEGLSTGATLSFRAEAPEFFSWEYPVTLTPTAGTTTLESEQVAVACKQQGGNGTLKGYNEVRLTIKLTECSMPSTGKKCGNAESGKTGVIETKELKGYIDYTYPEKFFGGGRETGIVFTPASGETVTDFYCGAAVHLVATGSFVGVLSPLRKFTKSLSLTFSGSGFTQVPSEYETEGGAQVAATPKLSVNSGEAKPLAIQSASSLATSFGEVEILAYL